MTTQIEAERPCLLDVEIQHTRQGGWAIHLGEQATVLEMATLIAAYNCTAEANGPGRFILVPVRDRPAPTYADIGEIFMARRAQRKHPRLKVLPSFNPCDCGAPGSYPHDPDCRSLPVGP